MFDLELGVSIIEEIVTVRYSLEENPFINGDLGFADPKYMFDTEHPERNVGDIAESKNIVKECRIFPSRCKQPLVSNANMQLAYQRMKLFNTEKRLEYARKKMNVKRRGMVQQWKDLANDEELFKRQFIEFNKFVRENYEKRCRASKKLEDDRKLIEERNRQLEHLTTMIDEITRTTAKMDENIKKYKIYQTFLQKVVDAGQFTTIKDIIDKYKSLEGAKELLLKNQDRTMDVLEHAMIDMMKLIEEKNFVIMGLNNQIANLQERYENANIKALESEALVTEIKNNATKQLSEIDSVKSSVWNVYVHMALSKKHPIKIKKDNVEEQMMYINRTLTELSKVNKLIKKKSIKIK